MKDVKLKGNIFGRTILQPLTKEAKARVWIKKRKFFTMDDFLIEFLDGGSTRILFKKLLREGLYKLSNCTTCKSDCYEVMK